MSNEPVVSLAWSNRYNELQDFYNEHGHTNVPSNYQTDPNDKYAQLARWIAKQRYHYKLYTGEIVTDKCKTLMTQEKIILLNNINFSFNSDSKRSNSSRKLTNDKVKSPESTSLRPQATPWHVRFEELKAYKEENGDCSGKHSLLLCFDLFFSLFF